MTKPVSRGRSLLFEEDGFSTLGMVIALLLALSLIFSAGKLYRISSESAHIQDVADAAALAAENEVAEFMILVRVCDAAVLTFTLTGIVAYGAGIAALCTPATAAFSEAIISVGNKVFKARDAFSEKASKALEELQKTLPFLAAASAAAVAKANASEGSEYFAVAMLVPGEGEPIYTGVSDAARELGDEIEHSKGEIESAAAEAEEASQEAEAAKLRAFEHDCGANPGYCMYERAGHLASLPPQDNPLYRSVDAWSFSVVLDRAKSYYVARAALEQPAGTSAEEQARSALRKRFYAYAAEEVSRGYVRDDGDSFDALFPELPSNTDQMRRTSLYTEAVYPRTEDEQGRVLHAWEGCPAASGFSARGSLAEMEAEGYRVCSACGFDAASLGKVAAASSSIDNGFEYHYAVVAQEAKRYEEARDRQEPASREVKRLSGDLFRKCGEVAQAAWASWIEADPPGRYGAIALVANVSAGSAEGWFQSSFVEAEGRLGARAAISGATLVEEPSGEAGNVVTSLLDGVRGQQGALTQAADMVLSCWSALLAAYAEGQSAVSSAVKDALDKIPLASASGLGTWASRAFSQVIDNLGLSPANMCALKPVIVNTSYVAEADSGGSFSSRFISVKESVLAVPASSPDVFGSVLSEVERAAIGSIEETDGVIEIATVEPFGEGGPSVPITIAVPPQVREAATGIVGRAVEALRSLYAEATGVRVWQ